MRPARPLHLLLCLGLAACGAGATGPGSDSRATPAVQLAPDGFVLPVGGSLRLAVAAINFAADGWTWSTSHPDLAEVSGDGRLTARGAGAATVRACAVSEPARCGTATVQLVAADPGVPTLGLFPPEATVPLGGVVQFSVSGTGLALPLYEWTAVPAGLGALSTNGVFRPAQRGMTGWVLVCAGSGARVCATAAVAVP